MGTQIPPPLPIDGSTTWWQRNWKWLIPACLGGIALFAGLIVLIVTIVFGMMRSSHAYKEALAMARADLYVKEALGSPIKDGLLVTGNINVAECPVGPNYMSAINMNVIKNRPLSKA